MAQNAAMDRLPLRCLAEGAGTFVLVFFGTGAIVVDDVTGGRVTPLGVALAFGLTVALVIVWLGGVSGAHINPAVSLGMALQRRLARRDLLPYVAAQLAGAGLASWALRALAPQHGTLGRTEPSAGVGSTFGLELAMTALLMAVILEVSSRRRWPRWAVALAVGATVSVEAFFGGPSTGASMNPARSFGPALVSGELGFLWIYFTAPLLGALGVSLAWRSRP